MGFFATLWASPRSTPLSRYTVGNGCFYLAMGALLLFWPGAMQVVLQAAPYEGHEAGLVRLAGMMLAVIGWFYVMGARTGADSFGLSTVVDRMLVPVCLVALGVSGALTPQLAYPFAIVDPLLGLGAFVVWKRQAASGAA